VLSASASGKYISLKTTITSDLVNKNEIKSIIFVLNEGDEAAYELEVTPKLPNEENVAKPIHSEILLPGENFNCNFSIFFNENITPGIYPLVVRIIYHDANMYQFSTVNSHLMKTTECDNSKIRGSLGETDITVEKPGAAMLTIWNDDSKSHELNISFFSPNELKTSFNSQNISINPLEEKQIKIDVGSFGALTGSSYTILASIEYDAEGRHYSSFANGVVRIVEEKQSLLLIIGVVVLFVLLLIIFVVYRFKRGK